MSVLTLPEAPSSSIESASNLLFNGSFEAWSGAALDQWTLVGAVAKQTTTYRFGTVSAALTRVGVDASLVQNAQVRAGTLSYIQGRTYTLAVWVFAAGAALSGRIALFDGVGRTLSPYHCGGSKWERLEVTRTLDLAATVLQAELRVDTNDGTVIFDGTILVEGDAPPAFFPNPADTSDPAVTDTTPPAMPTGLNLATGTAIGPDGTNQTFLDISWSLGSESDLAGYDVQYRRQGDTVPTARRVKKDVTSIREWGIVGNVVYEVRVAAFDTKLNPGTFTAWTPITTAKDTEAPNPPTAVSTIGGFQLVVVRWTPPTAADRDVVEVWRSTTNDSSTATKVGEDPGISFTDDKLANATTYYYWLKSRDTSRNVSGFHATQFAGVSGTTLTIATADVGDSQITTTKLGDSVVTTVKLGNAQVTTEKMADGSVTTIKIGDAQVTNTKLGDSSVTTIKIGDLQITAQKLADGSVTLLKFGSGLRPVEVGAALPAQPYTQGAAFFLTTDNKLYRSTGAAWTVAVPTVDLTGQITETQITDLAVTTPKLAALAVTAAKIAASTITSNEIAADTIVAGNIAAGAITASELAALAVVAGKIATDAVTAATIAAGAVTAAKIATGVIDSSHLRTDVAVITVAAQIANAIITNAHISNLSADKITAGLFSVLIRLGVNNIELDGLNSVITIKDTQGTPVTRVKIGKLGGGTTDWGIQIFNSAGALMWDLSQGAQNAGVAPNAIANPNIQELTLGTSKAQADAWSQAAYVRSDASYTITSNSTEEIIDSVTITTVGGRVEVFFKIDFNVASGQGFKFRVRRDSAELEFYQFDYITSNDRVDSFLLDAPAAGAYTYKLTGILMPAATATTVSHRRLMVVEAKK